MKRKLGVLVGVIWIVVQMSIVVAQDTLSLQCGDILEGEVSTERSPELPDRRRGDVYHLDMRAGTRITLTVAPLGSTFNVAIALRDEGGQDVYNSNRGTDGQPEIINDLQIASSNQVLVVMGAKPGSSVEVDDLRVIYYNGSVRDANAGHYFGGYEIRLGCTLRDGTVIEPGDALTQGGNAQPTAVALPSFGFPGLQPVDFASAFRLPLTMGTPTQGGIPPSGDAVLGFRFNGAVGDILDLSFERTSGNLNLGIVVLSADNQVAYMAALVSSQSMSSRFTLPATGEYTIGVFRISLVPPDSPEATDFTITVTLNQ